MTEEARKERTEPDGPERPPGRGARSIRGVFGLVFGALALFSGVSLFDDHYTEPRRALAEGVPGTYSLENDIRARGKNYHHGTFRSADGRVVEENIEAEGKDAKGLRPGEQFPARLLGHDDPYKTPVLVRTDEAGRGDITERGVQAAGIAVAGALLVALGLRSLILGPGSPRLRGLRRTLLIGLPIGPVMFIYGGIAGTGF